MHVPADLDLHVIHEINTITHKVKGYPACSRQNHIFNMSRLASFLQNQFYDFIIFIVENKIFYYKPSQEKIEVFHHNM